MRKSNLHPETVLKIRRIQNTYTRTETRHLKAIKEAKEQRKHEFQKLVNNGVQQAQIAKYAGTNPVQILRILKGET